MIWGVMGGTVSSAALAQELGQTRQVHARQVQATGSGQTGKGRASVANAPDAEPADDAAEQNRLDAWEGKTVLRVEFEGVVTSRLDPLPAQLAQQPNTPLRAVNLRQSLRRLYATGLYDTIAVAGRLETSAAGAGVVLIFRGQPRIFVGVVTVEGAKGANSNSLLVRASRLTPGARFTQASLSRAEAAMRHSLAGSGFYEPVFTYSLTQHPEEQLVDIAYKVVSGPQARVGAVAVSGDSGLTSGEFQHYAKLRAGHHVDHDTAGKALNGVENHYRKDQRLEAEVKLESRDYLTARKALDFSFAANRGPIVHVLVNGASLSEARVKRLVPVYEEGSVDEDLLNEGNRRLQNYYQRLGYFDVKVTHEQKPPTTDLVEIVYRVQLGARHRVGHVSITGAKYFDLPTLQERLSVRARDAFDRQGIYNQSLVANDVNSLQAIYANNGFPDAKVTPEIQDGDGPVASLSQTGHAKSDAHSKQVVLNVVYHIDEGQQKRVHSVQLVGSEKIPSAPLMVMLNTAAGQPLSPESLAGDRDTLLTYYLSRGFDQAQLDVTQAAQPNDASQVDITFHVREGEQVFLRRVLISGLHYTRPGTIARGITMKEGAPLDQTALLDTQRNLYDLALFNEVNPVIQNPTGQEPFKTVLLQTT